jgi:hypothetical protein
MRNRKGKTFQRIDERKCRYDGVLYDVVRQEIHGDTTWYYRLRDEDETRLFANLDELAKKHIPVADSGVGGFRPSPGFGDKR